MTTTNNTAVNGSGANTSGLNNSSNTSIAINATDNVNKTSVQPQITNTTTNTTTNVTVPVLNYTQPQ
jgi:hypothetical protein